MKKYLFLTFILVNASVLAESTHIGALAKLDKQNKHPDYSTQSAVPYPNIDVFKVFNIFLAAVDRGQLKLFDETLSREMLVPIRLEYVYTAELSYPMIKVYSELKEPMPLPSVPGANIIGVSGIMDLSGIL